MSLAIAALIGIGIGGGLMFCVWMGSTLAYLHSIMKSLIRIEYKR